MKKKATISPKVRELIEHGSTGDKVLAVILEWADAYARDLSPAITDAERKAILDTLTRSDWNVYFTYYAYYNTFVRFSTRLGLAQAIYERDANQLIGNYKAIQAEELVFSDAVRTLRDAGLAPTSHFNNLIKKNTLVDGEKPRFFYKTGDGVKWWENIKEGVEEVHANLRQLAEMTKGIDVFCRRAKRATECKKYNIDPKLVIPPLVKAVLAEVKADYVKDRAPALSKTILERRLKRGEVVSAEERARAIFPTYKEVEAETEPDEIEYWVDMLERHFYKEQKAIERY